MLALAVLLGHAHGIGGYVMVGGSLAVQCFFITSGFYMGLVLNERYDVPALNRTFWINRAIRIYAVYFLFLALYFGLFALLQARGMASPLDPYLEGSLPWSEKAGLALLNLTVIGQDLPLWLTIEQGHLIWTDRFVGSGDGAVFRYMLIPAAWSLSLELCFYAIAPFIARRPAWQIALLMVLSLLARVIAGVLGYSADPFSYRFFPFELALFLAGVLAYKAWAVRRDWWAHPSRRLLALAVLVAIVAWPWLRDLSSVQGFFAPPRLFLLGLVAVGLPAIHAWSQHSRTDREIGELSYPFYLGHLLILGVVAGVPALEGNDAAATLVAIAATLLVSWLVVRVIEPPIEAFRRALAERAGATDKGRDTAASIG
jgi:peptidoglycan/LPS O-acetylase OafA/YrhL